NLEMMDESLRLLEPLKSQLSAVPGYLSYLADLHARRQRPDLAIGLLKSLVRENGFHGEDFICTTCSTRYKAWQARCGQCRAWDTITLEVGTVKAETLSNAPLYY